VDISSLCAYVACKRVESLMWQPVFLTCAFMWALCVGEREIKTNTTVLNHGVRAHRTLWVNDRLCVRHWRHSVEECMMRLWHVSCADVCGWKSCCVFIRIKDLSYSSRFEKKDTLSQQNHYIFKTRFCPPNWLCWSISNLSQDLISTY